MTDPALSIQKAIRARLIASSAVTDLVPVANVALDDSRPSAMPSIILGPANVSYMDKYEQWFDEVFAEIHLWTNEPDLASVKEIAGAVRSALDAGVLNAEGFRVINSKIASARYLRDPDNTHSRAILSVEAILQATS